MAKRDLLELEIARAGSVAALARLLRVRPATVSAWRRSGIIRGGQVLLAGLEVARQSMRAEEKKKRQVFDELFKLAGELGHLPKAKTREGVRAGPRTSGYRWVKAIGQMLTPGLIGQIDAWLTSKRRRFPYFQAVAVVSEYGTETFKGYKTVMKPMEGRPEAGDFAIEEQIPTSRSKSLGACRDELVGKLEDMLEEGHVVYIHSVALSNYRLRTDDERKAWESSERYARKKKKKKKDQKEKKEQEKKTWPKKKQKTASKPSKKSQGSSKPKKGKKSSPTAKSQKKSVSTRSQRSRSSSRPASGKRSQQKTSASRSGRTTSRSSTKKPGSSSTTKRKTQTSAAKARVTTRTTTRTKTRTKTKTKTKAKTKKGKR